MSNQSPSDQTTSDIREELVKIKDKWEEALLDAEGEITDRVKQIEDSLTEKEETARDKIANIKHFIEYLDEQIAALDGMIDYHERRAKNFKRSQSRLNDHRERMKDKIVHLLDALEESKIKIDGETLYIQTYERTEVNLTDEQKERLIDEYNIGERRVSLHVGKSELKQAIKNGDIEETEWSDQIRIKTTKSLRGI